MTRHRIWLSRYHPSSSPRVLRIVLGFLLLGIIVAHADAQNSVADEYDIRAAMLFNITRFVEWPTSKLNPQHPQMLVCIAGPDPIGPGLDHFLQSQKAGIKSISVRHLNSLESAEACHVLYVSLREQKDVKKFVPSLAKANVLLISEKTNAGSPDQVIGLPTLDEHVHIEVNLAAAQRAGITISSKLLRLATVTR